MTEQPTQPPMHQIGKHGARWLKSKHAGWILAAISFAESVFAPIIIDPFLIALILARRERWLRYIYISVIFSIFGGVVAYILGSLFFDFIGTWIIGFYGLENQFTSVSKNLDANGFVFVLLGALTPIPYKIVALTSGLAQINFITFLFASIVGRILRLGLVGGATYLVGPHALPIIRKHLLHLAYVLAFILIVYFVIQIF